MKKYTLGRKLFAAVLHQMFMIMVVCSLFAMDELVRTHEMENLMELSMLSIIGLVGTFIALAYLTNVSGYRDEDEKEVFFHPIDKVYGDILTILFILVIWVLLRYTLHLRKQDFELAGLLVSAGTLTYLFDIIFMTFYLSIIRRSKANILYTRTLLYVVYAKISERMAARKQHQPVTRKAREQRKVCDAIEAIASGELDTTLSVEEFHGTEKHMAEAVNHIRDGMSEALARNIRNERMKADLITNVSHDIKTPLTSIVNYVDLLKREEIDNENAQKYIRILDDKSQRLKQLTEDLVEASKISSGNVKLDMQRIDFVELLCQTGGEFNERFEARNLTIVTKLPHDPVYIRADGRQLYRAIENLYTNAAKYALEKTRVYVELGVEKNEAVFTMKNISKNVYQGDLAKGALAERFVRGETSRTTEGSGLGLSITKSLTELMGGTFTLTIDGDLFIITVSFGIA
ncbi:MAG: HAMP domain-containing histidine kinase [Agathobacter sp.]|nr:HAMP domain-containing histidine kinase [Agathobacter sp.]